MRAFAQMAPALVLATGLVTSGCGTASVMSTDPTARLYAGGRMLGKGTGQLQRRGLPGSTVVVAVSEDGRRSQTIAKREFTAFTFVTGLFTYGVCLIACWEYPSVILVGPPPTPYAGHPGGYPPAQGAFAGPDPWLQPPAGWQPKEPVTPAPASPPQQP
jgi:hypothetical protein